MDALTVGFTKNEAAMVYIGDWYLLQKTTTAGFYDLGVFMLPGITAKGKNAMIIEGRPTLIGAKTPHLNDALRLTDYVMSAEGSKIIAGNSENQLTKCQGFLS